MMRQLSQNILEHFLPAKVPANGLTSKIDELTSAPDNFIVVFRLSKNFLLCAGVKNQVSSGYIHTQTSPDTQTKQRIPPCAGRQRCRWV
jgi:hypothetical protein